MLLLFAAVTASSLSYGVVMHYTTDIDAVVKFVRDNLIISLAGGCALYVVLFLLVKRAIESFIDRDK